MIAVFRNCYYCSMCTLFLLDTILWQYFARFKCLALPLVWYLVFSTFYRHLLVYSQLTRYVMFLLDEELRLYFIHTGNQCSMKNTPYFTIFCFLLLVESYVYIMSLSYIPHCMAAWSESTSFAGYPEFVALHGDCCHTSSGFPGGRGRQQNCELHRGCPHLLLCLQLCILIRVRKGNRKHFAVVQNYNSCYMSCSGQWHGLWMVRYIHWELKVRS